MLSYKLVLLLCLCINMQVFGAPTVSDGEMNELNSAEFFGPKRNNRQVNSQVIVNQSQDGDQNINDKNREIIVRLQALLSLLQLRPSQNLGITPAQTVQSQPQGELVIKLPITSPNPNCYAQHLLQNPELIVLFHRIVEVCGGDPNILLVGLDTAAQNNGGLLGGLGGLLGGQQGGGLLGGLGGLLGGQSGQLGGQGGGLLGGLGGLLGTGGQGGLLGGLGGLLGTGTQGGLLGGLGGLLGGGQGGQSGQGGLLGGLGGLLGGGQNGQGGLLGGGQNGQGGLLGGLGGLLGGSGNGQYGQGGLLGGLGGLLGGSGNGQFGQGGLLGGLGGLLGGNGGSQGGNGGSQGALLGGLGSLLGGRGGGQRGGYQSGGSKGVYSNEEDCDEETLASDNLGGGLLGGGESGGLLGGVLGGGKSGGLLGSGLVGNVLGGGNGGGNGLVEGLTGGLTGGLTNGITGGIVNGVVDGALNGVVENSVGNLPIVGNLLRRHVSEATSKAEDAEQNNDYMMDLTKNSMEIPSMQSRPLNQQNEFSQKVMTNMIHRNDPTRQDQTMMMVNQEMQNNPEDKHDMPSLGLNGHSDDNNQALDKSKTKRKYRRRKYKIVEAPKDLDVETQIPTNTDDYFETSQYQKTDNGNFRTGYNTNLRQQYESAEKKHQIDEYFY